MRRRVNSSSSSSSSGGSGSVVPAGLHLPAALPPPAPPSEALWLVDVEGGGGSGYRSLPPTPDGPILAAKWGGAEDDDGDLPYSTYRLPDWPWLPPFPPSVALEAFPVGSGGGGGLPNPTTPPTPPRRKGGR